RPAEIQRPDGRAGRRAPCPFTGGRHNLGERRATRRTGIELDRVLPPAHGAWPEGHRSFCPLGGRAGRYLRRLRGGRRFGSSTERREALTAPRCVLGNQCAAVGTPEVVVGHGRRVPLGRYG